MTKLRGRISVAMLLIAVMLVNVLPVMATSGVRLYVDGVLVTNHDAQINAQGVVILPNGTHSARQIFPHGSDWGMLGESTEEMKLDFVSFLLGHEFQQVENTVWLTIGALWRPDMVFVNGQLVSNPDIVIDRNEGLLTVLTVMLPNGRSSLETFVPVGTNLQDIPNMPLRLGAVAQNLNLSYVFDSSNGVLHITIGRPISNVNLRFVRNDMAVVVPHIISSNGRILITEAVLRQLFAYHISIMPVPSLPTYDFIEWAEFLGYTITRYSNYVFFRNDARRPIMVFAEGRIIDFPDQQPVIQNSRTLVPIGSLVNALGGATSWDGEQQLATIYSRGITIHIYIGRQTMFINGTPHLLDVPAQIINGRTMIPLRSVGEGLDYEVSWSPRTQLDQVEMWMRFRTQLP